MTPTAPADAAPRPRSSCTGVRAWARAVRGAVRQGAIPYVTSLSIAMLAVAALLAQDRGREPGVVVRSSSAPLDSLPGSVGLAVGLLSTWAGMAVVGGTVAWTVGYDLEHRLYDTYRSLGIRLGRRFLVNLLCVYAGSLAAVVGLASLAYSAGTLLQGWSSPPDSERLALDWSFAFDWFLATAFWWVAATVLVIVLRSSVLALGTLVSLTVTGLLSSNLASIAPWLPTTWLGALSGFDRGAATVSDPWANGAALGFEWAGTGHRNAAVAIGTLSALGAMFVWQWCWRMQRHKSVG